VGGGSKNALLNQLTANATGLEVVAGPGEATAIGNVAAQALAVGKLKKPEDVRHMVRNSFPLKTYRPRGADEWDARMDAFRAVAEKAQKIKP
jgi:rhamnulokinase